MKTTVVKKIGVPRVAVVIILTFLAILLVSFTIGKDIYEGRNHTLVSFSLIHFSGYLFFLLMPVEMAFFYYLNWYDQTTLIWVALVTATFAQSADYLIGYSFNGNGITRLVNARQLQKAEKYITKYGNFTIFVFNFLPLSSPIIALAAGFLKYRFTDLFIFSIAGLFLKYLLLSLIYFMM